MTNIWKEYNCEDFYDEVMSSPGIARKSAKKLVSHFMYLSDEAVDSRRKAAESTIKEMGVSFTVYTDCGNNIDRSWPFDMNPSNISKAQWDKTAEGYLNIIEKIQGTHNKFIDHNKLVDDM